MSPNTRVQITGLTPYQTQYATRDIQGSQRVRRVVEYQYVLNEVKNPSARLNCRPAGAEYMRWSSIWAQMWRTSRELSA